MTKKRDPANELKACKAALRHTPGLSYDRSAFKRYKQAKIRKRRNQKKIPTPKTEVGKIKLPIRYLYHEHILQAE